MSEMTTAKIMLATKAFGAARAAVQDCRAQVNEFADADENYPDDFSRDEYMEGLAERLAELSRRAIDALRIVLELLDLDATRESLDAEVAAFQGSDFTTVGYFDEYVGASNVVVDALNRRLERIAPLLEIPTGTANERRVLVRMLKQTAHYLHSIGEVPGREKDVQDALQPTLRLAFPDVVREPPIPKQTKTYRPDFGIESIETAVEVKYADDPQKAKSEVGELYEDMKGYADSEFTLFIGLIYMTAPYLSQEQVDAELKKVGTPKNWRVYLIVGAGKPKGKGGPAKPAEAATA